MGFGTIMFKEKEYRDVIEQLYIYFFYSVNYLPKTISSLPKIWIRLSKEDLNSVIVKIKNEKRIIKDKNIRSIIEKIYNLEDSSLWIDKSRLLRVSLSNMNRDTILVEV